MKRLIALACCSFLLCPSLVLAGASKGPKGPNTKKIRAEIKKLAFLTGRFEGGGWMARGGKKHTFQGKESVRFELDGTVLVIEGVHRDQDEGPTKGQIVHQTMAVISYDESAELYRFDSWLADGRRQNSTGQLVDGAFVWTMKPGGPVEIRFTIRRNKSGAWVEKGAMTHDGTKWREFFGMTLKSAS